jgi:hypothetical protein
VNADGNDKFDENGLTKAPPVPNELADVTAGFKCWCKK